MGPDHRRLLRPVVFFVFFFAAFFFAALFVAGFGVLFVCFVAVETGLGLDQINCESSTSCGAFVGGTRGIWSQIPGPPRPLSYTSVEVMRIPSAIDDLEVSASVRLLASAPRDWVNCGPTSLVITVLDFAAELFVAWHHIL